MAYSITTSEDDFIPVDKWDGDATKSITLNDLSNLRLGVYEYTSATQDLKINITDNSNNTLYSVFVINNNMPVVTATDSKGNDVTADIIVEEEYQDNETVLLYKINVTKLISSDCKIMFGIYTAA